jgi:hypothetical protein
LIDHNLTVALAQLHSPTASNIIQNVSLSLTEQHIPEFQTSISQKTDLDLEEFLMIEKQCVQAPVPNVPKETKRESKATIIDLNPKSMKGGSKKKETKRQSG